MSYVVAAPEWVASAASDVARIGSILGAANAAAATSTSTALSAAEDEVSAAIASLFSDHGEAYQALSARVSAFHDQFAAALNQAGTAYAAAEAANANPLEALGQGVLKRDQCPHQRFARPSADR